MARPDRSGQDEEQTLVDCVRKEFLCDPMVLDAIRRLVNMPGVDMNILKLAASPSSVGKGGGGGSISDRSHTPSNASQGRHHRAECTGSDLCHFVSGLGCGGGREGKDGQFDYSQPKTLSSRYTNFVGFEEQPSGGTHRNVPTSPLAAENSMLPMFKENCEKVHVPSRSLEGAEEVDECDELVSSFQTKPTEETLASLLPGTLRVMEETQSGGRHSIYVPKPPEVWHPHGQAPTVSIAPTAKYIFTPQIPERNVAATDPLPGMPVDMTECECVCVCVRACVCMYVCKLKHYRRMNWCFTSHYLLIADLMSGSLLRDFQRLHGYSEKRRAAKQKLKNWLQLLTLRRCRMSTKQLFLPYTTNKERKHGLALIIVNENFRCHPDDPKKKALPRRPSAIADIDRLVELWTFLGFRVRVERDLTEEQIRSLFDEIREDGDPDKTIQEGDDSFVCFFSSHGTWDQVLGRDVVWGVDGVRREDGKIIKGALDIKALAIEKFSPLKTGCPKLKGRPKVFFIQACRGGKCDRTICVYDPETDTLPEDDFVFVYSTSPGKLSYRKDPYGSFFVTDLSLFLTLYADKRDLISIIQAVIQKETVLDDPYEILNDRGDIIQRIRQCPNYTSSLRGPVFFFDKACRRYEKLALC